MEEVSGYYFILNKNDATWVHGDMALTNLVFENSRLVGVIDFGQINIGDPACELIIGYTLLNAEEYKYFKENLSYLPEDIWLRKKLGRYGKCYWW